MEDVAKYHYSVGNEDEIDDGRSTEDDTTCQDVGDVNQVKKKPRKMGVAMAGAEVAAGGAGAEALR